MSGQGITFTRIEGEAPGAPVLSVQNRAAEAKRMQAASAVAAARSDQQGVMVTTTAQEVPSGPIGILPGEPGYAEKVLIETTTGMEVTRDIVAALESGRELRGHGAEVLEAIWNRQRTGERQPFWHGLQAAAWIASRSIELVSCLNSSLIEFRTSEGAGMVHQRHVDRELRWEIGMTHCACGMTPAQCVDLDVALGMLNKAVRNCELFELGAQFRGVINLDNARQMKFLSRHVIDLFSPRAAQEPVTDLAGAA